LFNCRKQNIWHYICYMFVPDLWIITLLKNTSKQQTPWVWLHINKWILLSCIWHLKAPYPTHKVSCNDRRQNDFLVPLQFHQCFPYQTSWREPTLGRMFHWSVTQRLTPHLSTIGQRKEGIWSSRVSEITISHDLGNVIGKLRDLFLRKQRLLDSWIRLLGYWMYLSKRRIELQCQEVGIWRETVIYVEFYGWYLINCCIYSHID